MSRRGFTLIELSLVAAALAVLLAAVMPRFSEAAATLRLERAAFGMTRGLRAAHELAVMQERVIAWTWDEAARRARLAQMEDDGRMTQMPGPIGQGELVPSALRVSVDFDESEEAGQLLFFPDGTSQPGRLHLVDARAAYTITVDASTSQPRLAADAAP